MDINITVRTPQDCIDIRNLRSFMQNQSLGYKNYEDWVERAISELQAGYKTGILAFTNGTLVGDLVFQDHKGLHGLREIKNLRIHELMHGRGLAQFLLRQVETIETEGLLGIICDVQEQRQNIIRFMVSRGYQKLATRSLYDPNELDVILIKPLHNNPIVLYK